MKNIYEKVCSILGESLLVTGLFLLILYIAERIGMLAVSVESYNRQLIYPYEVGGVFFIMLLTATFFIQLLKWLALKKYKQKIEEK